jgi:hypothetical protein
MVYLQVLSGDIQAAEVLAVEVHRDLSVEEIDMDSLPQLTLPLEQCGMWIDPIGMTHILHSALCNVARSVGLIIELPLFIYENSSKLFFAQYSYKPRSFL